MLLLVFCKKHNMLNFSFQFYFIAKLGSNKMCEMAQLLMISEHFLKVRKYYLFLFSYQQKGWIAAVCVTERQGSVWKEKILETSIFSLRASPSLWMLVFQLLLLKAGVVINVCCWRPNPWCCVKSLAITWRQNASHSSQVRVAFANITVLQSHWALL